MTPAIIASAPPAGHPAVPPGIARHHLVAIVTVHHADAPNANRNISHHRLSLTAEESRANRRALTGENVYLRRIGDQHCFSFGGQRSANVKANRDRDQQDVYIPGTGAGIRQCSLVPDWQNNAWRLHSTSENVMTVNGVPIQNYTATTRKQQDPLPHAIYLKQSEVNVLEVNGIRIDVWLMKSVHQVYEQEDFKPPNLQALVQDVAGRPEPWARERWNLTEERVSRKTFRVIQRFTGDLQTAKVFEAKQRKRQLRDQEFLMFNRQEVDASIVRYLYSTEFTNLPAVITDSHEGFVTYAAMQAEIHKSHPSARFEIATTLLRRIFFGLGFMHFHGIIHGHVSNDSVVMKMVGGKVDRVLLVDYTGARPFDSGAPLPMDQILADGRAAMEIVENCCDIWAFRNGPTAKAMGEQTMQRRTAELLVLYQAIRRVNADFFEHHQGSHSSDKGKKLERLLNKCCNDWQSARNAQDENQTLREVKPLSKLKIDVVVEACSHADDSPVPWGIHQRYMLLSLGHPYLDSLANSLYLKRWNITPHEVCSKFKEFGGDFQHPWQTFEVKKATKIMYGGYGYTDTSVLAWLASCCEIYPEWREVLERAVPAYIDEHDLEIDGTSIGNLYAALQNHGTLPPTMVAMFDRLIGTEEISTLVEETYQVSYHVPSRLFNLTQLHRLASPERLQRVVNEEHLPCENFAEVRGDPKIEGCYAHLTILASFCRVLGLELPQHPDLTAMPTLDPSDFSEVQPGRIILARPGLLGFASMIRSGEQCNFLNPKAPETFDTENAFIPTYFGDMPVLPKLPYGGRHYERPSHWSKYKTAAETEATTSTSKRKVLPTKAPSKGKGRVNHASPVVQMMDMDIDMDDDEDTHTVHKTKLGKILREREAIRAAARSPPERTVSGSAAPSRDASPVPKRARPSPTAKIPEITDSFIMNIERHAQAPVYRSPSGEIVRPHRRDHERSAMDFMGQSAMGRGGALFARLPSDPVDDVNQSFTVADADEILEEDWKTVQAMLDEMPDEDDEDYVPFTAFRHHGNDGDGDDDVASIGSTEPDTTGFNERFPPNLEDGYVGKGKGRADAPTNSKSTPYGSHGSHGQSLFDTQPSQKGPPKSSFSIFRSHKQDAPSAPDHDMDADDMPDTQPSSPVLPSDQPTSQMFGAGFGAQPSNDVGGSSHFGNDLGNSFSFGNPSSAPASSFPPFEV